MACTFFNLSETACCIFKTKLAQPAARQQQKNMFYFFWHMFVNYKIHQRRDDWLQKIQQRRDDWLAEAEEFVVNLLLLLLYYYYISISAYIIILASLLATSLRFDVGIVSLCVKSSEGKMI